jgi:hypothetical protein
MKNKAPIIVKEVTSVKEKLRTAIDSTESYEEMVADIARQMSERTQQSRQAVSKGKAKRSITSKRNPSTEQPIEEPLSIDQELLLIAGSEEAYERMMASLESQMAHIAKTRGRFDLKNNRFVPIEKPKPPRKSRSTKHN